MRNDKFVSLKNKFEKVIETAASFEISETTGKTLDEECNKVLGSLYKDNQERMNMIMELFKEVNRLKSEANQLSEDIDRNLKYLGKEIFGNTEKFRDVDFLFQKLNFS